MISNTSLSAFSVQPGPASVQQRTPASVSLPSGSIGSTGRTSHPASGGGDAPPGRRGALLDIQA